MALARFERDFTDEDGNLLTGNVSVEVRRMSGGLPQLYSDRDGAAALGNPFVNGGGSVAFHVAGNAYRVTATQGAFSRELTYVAIGLAGESDFTLARNQGDWSAIVTYARGDYVVHDDVGLFISTQDGNLNHEPDDATPASTTYWTYYPGLQGPAGPAGAGMDWQPGGWITATGYLVGDGVAKDGSSYICLVAHTSGVFATDLAALKWELIAAKGDTGATGAAGSNGTNGTNGTNGSDGSDPGVLLNFDTATADADPGAGDLRANNASLASATLLYVSKTSRGGSSIANFLATLDDSTNTVKGVIVLTDPATEAQAVFNVTSLTDATGYVKVGVSAHSGATAFANALPISFQFSRAGDVGASGAGTGDVVGPASVTSGNPVLFDGATGKLIKESTFAAFKTALAIAVADVTDMTANGRSLVSAANYAAMKTLLAVAVADITDMTANGRSLVSAANYAAMKTLLAVAVADITDATANGRSLISAANYAAMKTLLAIAQADVSGLTTASSPQFTGVELGHATDTTLSRSAAGVLAVEGVVVPTVSSTSTLTNKRVTPRVNSIASSATPTTNTDSYDIVDITALAAAITSMTTNLSGTPTIGQVLIYQIKDNGTARAIAWGASFAAMGVALPTTTVLSKRLTAGFMWNGTNWGCVGSAQEA